MSPGDTAPLPHPRSDVEFPPSPRLRLTEEDALPLPGQQDRRRIWSPGNKQCVGSRAVTNKWCKALKRNEKEKGGSGRAAAGAGEASGRIGTREVTLGRCWGL